MAQGSFNANFEAAKMLQFLQKEEKYYVKRLESLNLQLKRLEVEDLALKARTRREQMAYDKLLEQQKVEKEKVQKEKVQKKKDQPIFEPDIYDLLEDIERSLEREKSRQKPEDIEKSLDSEKSRQKPAKSAVNTRSSRRNSQPSQSTSSAENTTLGSLNYSPSLPSQGQPSSMDTEVSSRPEDRDLEPLCLNPTFYADEMFALFDN